MKFQKSLTPRLTDVGPVNYSTLSDGSVMKIPMKSFHGFPPWNSTTLKISFLTFILLIPTNPDPYLVYNLLLQFLICSAIFFLKPSLSLIFYLYFRPFFQSFRFFKKTRNFIYKQNFYKYFLLYHHILHFPFLIPIPIPFFLCLLHLLHKPFILNHLPNSLQTPRDPQD